MSISKMQTYILYKDYMLWRLHSKKVWYSISIDCIIPYTWLNFLPSRNLFSSQINYYFFTIFSISVKKKVIKFLCLVLPILNFLLPNCNKSVLLANELALFVYSWTSTHILSLKHYYFFVVYFIITMHLRHV